MRVLPVFLCACACAACLFVCVCVCCLSFFCVRVRVLPVFFLCVCLLLVFFVRVCCLCRNLKLKYRYSVLDPAFAHSMMEYAQSSSCNDVQVVV